MKFSRKTAELLSLSLSLSLSLRAVEKLVRNSNFGTKLCLFEPGIRNKLAIKVPYKAL